MVENGACRAHKERNGKQPVTPVTPVTWPDWLAPLMEPCIHEEPTQGEEFFDDAPPATETAAGGDAAPDDIDDRPDPLTEWASTGRRLVALLDNGRVVPFQSISSLPEQTTYVCQIGDDHWTAVR